MAKSRKFNLHDGKLGAAITVRVTHHSSRNEISEILNDGTIKIRLTAPASEGESNQALIQFLAQTLGIEPNKIEIIAGLSGQDKLVSILSLDSDMVQDRILKNLA